MPTNSSFHKLHTFSLAAFYPANTMYQSQ